MTLEEIKTKICDLRCSVEELQEEAYDLWKESEDAHTENLALFVEDALGVVASKLAELEDLEEEEEEEQGGEDDTDLQEWWEGLYVEEKGRIVGLPAPCANDSGVAYHDFHEYADKWWCSRTFEQKKAIKAEWEESF